MLLSLGHVTVLSTDLARTERFYGELLGLRVGPRPAIRIPGCWLYLGDQPVLHVLARQSAAPPGDTQPAIDHFALNASNRAGFEQRLQAAGQAFESRRLADSDTWQIFLNDPDGARVELSFAPTPNRASA
jgi:catechol 2,3-dioxygenase-like lactoylglutathione lyase family enzyme